MAEIIEGTHPTRMELLNIKKKTKLAEKGHRLLKEKRDALILEFMNAIKRAENIVSETTKQLKVAQDNLTIASATLGRQELGSVALATTGDIKVDTQFRNIMGVNIPRLNIINEIERRPDQRGYNLTFTSPVVDKVASEYEKTITHLVELAEVENILFALSEETRKVKRRVNALEYRVVPQLKETQKYIQMRLDEIERENFYRLKTVKKKRGA